MPFAEFNPSNSLAGLQFVQGVDSMFERASRLQMDRERLDMQKKQVAADLASQDVDTQMKRIQLGEMQASVDVSRMTREQRIHELENTTTLQAEWDRTGQATVNDTITRMSAESDPDKIAVEATKLAQLGYRYAAHPTISKQIAAATESLYGQSEAMNAAITRAGALAGKVFPSLDEAQKAHPGFKVMPRSVLGKTAYFVSNEPDEQDNVVAARINAADTLEEMKQILGDKESSVFLRNPNSATSRAWTSQLQLLKMQQAQTTLDRKEQDANAKLDRTTTVRGFTGHTVGPVVTQKVQETAGDLETSVFGLRRLQQINEELAKNPTKNLDLALRGEASVLSTLVQAANRLQIVGPGAVSVEEWKMLADAVNDPSKLSSTVQRVFFGDEVGRAKLQTTIDTMLGKFLANASAYGLDAQPDYWTPDAIVSRYKSRMPNSTPAAPTASSLIDAAKKRRGQ